MNAKGKALGEKVNEKPWGKKKFENKHGYHIVVEADKAKKYFPKWGRLDPEYASTQDLAKRHGVRKSQSILTHSTWARGVMKKDYDKYK